MRVQKAAISTIYHDMGLDFGASNVLECFSASVSAISSAKMSLWESSVKNLGHAPSISRFSS